MADTLQKFMFENSAVRGELVELSDTWQQVQSRRDYPKAVRSLLGDMLAAAALLTANLKFDGSLIMQVHGDGPVNLLVVECDSTMQMRATAKYGADADIPDDASLRELLNVHGKGRFAITLDPREKMPGQQAYQGIVPLDGDDVASVIEQYMLRSEQLDTRLWLASDDKVTRGLLLQRMPAEGGFSKGDDTDLEEWNHAITLAATLKHQELLEVDIQTLLRRLFWEDDIRVFEPRHPRFHCSCSRERVGNMLRMLGRDEIDSALSELGMLAIDCDFCGQHYEFDSVDCARLFVADASTDAAQPPSPTRH